MPRNLSPTSLAKIQQRLGTEPVTIISLEFRPFFKVYFADKNIPSEGISGRINELGNLDDVLRTDSGSATGTIRVVCDDSDGLLKSIYDRHDIHKQPVIIYQWFTNIPYAEKFIIFEGQVVSPISWDEGERTFSFDVASKVEDREVGFSPEEGSFDFIEPDQIGKAWPLAFGSPRYVPLTPLTTVPTAILMDPFGIPDEGICAQIQRLLNQPRTNNAPPVPQDIPATTPIDEANKILESNAKAYASWAEGEAKAGADVAQQVEALQQTYNDQKKWLPKRYLAISIDPHFPLGHMTVKIDEKIFNVQVYEHEPGKTAYMTIERDPPNPLPIPQFRKEDGEAVDNTYGANKLGFQFFNAGAAINIMSDYKIAHVANCINTHIDGIYAYRKYGGIRRLTLLPSKYYTIAPIGVGTISETDITQSIWQLFGINPNDTLDLPFFEFRDKLDPDGLLFKEATYPTLSNSWFHPVFVILNKKMSTTSFLVEHDRQEVQSYIDSLPERNRNPIPSHVQNTEEWEDELYVSMTSSVGPNIVDILRWIITTFTTMFIDEDSFNHVHDLLANYPAHFCLFDRKNVIELINEIAIQARCSIWLKNRKFYIRYLSEEPEPIDTITEDDIEYKSLKIESTDTESIVTKYKAKWKMNYLGSSKDNMVIIRSNIAKYGVQEEDVDYYIFNVHYSVKKSATFWSIRKSNTWKRVKFNTFLHKLNLETMDCVLLDFAHPYIANGPVKGIIESAVYDSANYTINMTVWVPVKIGSMEIYPFVWPANISETDYYPTINDIQSGGGTVGLIPYKPMSLPPQGAGPSNSVVEENSSGFVTHHAGGDLRFISVGIDTIGTRIPSDRRDQVLTESNYVIPNEAVTPGPVPLYDYGLHDRKLLLKPVADTKTTLETSVFPGRVTEGEGAIYKLDTFPDGLRSAPKIVEGVTQLQIAQGETVPAGTWVFVCKLVDSNKNTQYFMQAPVWLP